MSNAGKNDKSKAGISGGALVASFPGKDGPVLWRAELARLHDAAFTVETQEDGKPALCLKEAGGRREVLAVFGGSEAAAEALAAVSQALFAGRDGGGRMLVLASMGKRILWVLTALLVLVLFMSISGGPTGTGLPDKPAPSTATAPLAPANIPPRPGVPLSADDVFGR